MKTKSRGPLAEKRPLTRVIHGTDVRDDYGWLRSAHWQEVFRDQSVLEPDIRAHLEAENAHTDAFLADTKALQDQLVKEMRGRIKEDDSSVPAPDGPFAYASRYEEGAQHPKFVRTAREGGAEEILIDADALAKGKAYFRLAGASHSPDHTLLAWAFDDKGSEYYTLKFRDIASGADLADEIGSTSGGGAWSSDAKDVFYAVLNENHRTEKIFLHRLGSPASDDTLVYKENDAAFFLGVGKTQSGRFIVIDSHDHETSEVRVIPADDPTAEPRLVAPRETGVEYNVDDDGGDLFYVLTNADAPDFKIVAAPVASPGRENWTAVVPHKPGRLILGMTVYRGRMVRLERENGLPRIVIRDLASGAEHAIDFDEEAYSLGLMGSFEFDTDILRFSYSSPTTPSRVYDYNMATGERTLRKEQEVPSGHNPDDYVTRRLHVPAADGELIPLTLLYANDTPLDGSAPVLLYGYGAYGIAMSASFSTTSLSLVDRGFIHATAHIRGGNDKGDYWYRTARKAGKTKTFTDFIACGDYLVEEGFTRRGNIVAMGGSAGGMLMGAVANMAPTLFGGIIAVVPFVDVLNTMMDDTLPLTPPEWPEWGNPIESQEAFEIILSYSPYENVSAKPYPPILAVAGLTDPRVTYWEPAKWVARLRELSTSDNPVLLQVDMDSGHGGASGRFDALKEYALRYAFALKVTGKA
ncbi:Protease 2 [Hartmannibacter diazotrophicus]|uniref:Protease 2 n=1 Tax=Hartmannibacter diazotrophicus TaxID=1482074 RepID=A0A2C9D3L0_9HYPH|nr:S9 family peptidase [Hartmannibacter diazotrophicus]SON54850.1 Protease 2 [Hartmannibacter diazotrophicus]